MSTMMDIDAEDIAGLFDSVIYLRGEEYFEQGRVMSIELIDSGTITGIVSGSHDYAVTVSIDDDGDIICDCSCPCDFDCKHAAALLQEWLSVKGSYDKKLIDAKTPAKQSIKEILNKKNKEELVELLGIIISKHPELKSLVSIERKEIISKIRVLFSNFWEWNEVDDLISQLNTILEGIKRNKDSWDINLLNDMESASNIIIENIENVHDEGDLGIFLEDWFETFGEVFSKTKPNIKEKKEFMQKIHDWMDEDEYGLDNSYEKALLGMCKTEEDIRLIKEFMNQKESEYDDDYTDFYLELYDKIGMDEKYVELAEQSGSTRALIDKLVSLNRLDEALETCEKSNKKEFSEQVENRKIDILKKLGKEKELKEAILDMLKRTGNFSYFVKLKQETPKKEWAKYFKESASDAESKKRFALLSRIYYHEGNFKKAYEYSDTTTDLNYLELLAKKLSIEYPELACRIFRKMCFEWICDGSGWPYKKAGNMLKAIKKLDVSGEFFKETKAEIIRKYKQKWSLMKIIEKV